MNTFIYVCGAVVTGTTTDWSFKSFMKTKCQTFTISGFWKVLYYNKLNIFVFWVAGQTKQSEDLTSGKLTFCTLNDYLKKIHRLIDYENMKIILSSSPSHNRFVHSGNVRVYSGDDSRITNETSAIRLLTPSGHSLALACIGHVVYTRPVLKWVFLVPLNQMLPVVLSLLYSFKCGDIIVYISRASWVSLNDIFIHESLRSCSSAISLKTGRWALLGHHCH